jgi:hypothetical protein
MIGPIGYQLTGLHSFSSDCSVLLDMDLELD